MTSLIGYAMTIKLTLYVLSWRLRLGLLALDVVLLWRSLSQHRLWFLSILFLFASVVCMGGLLIAVDLLACWPTAACWSRSTPLG